MNNIKNFIEAGESVMIVECLSRGRSDTGLIVEC